MLCAETDFAMDLPTFEKSHSNKGLPQIMRNLSAVTRYRRISGRCASSLWTVPPVHGHPATAQLVTTRPLRAHNEVMTNAVLEHPQSSPVT